MGQLYYSTITYPWPSFPIQGSEIMTEIYILQSSGYLQQRVFAVWLTGPLHTWTHQRLWMNAQDWHKIKATRISAWIGEMQLMKPTPSWGALGNCWYLVEWASATFRNVAPERLPVLPKLTWHPSTHRQHQVDSVWFTTKLVKLGGEMVGGIREGLEERDKEVDLIKLYGILNKNVI